MLGYTEILLCEMFVQCTWFSMVASGAVLENKGLHLICRFCHNARSCPQWKMRFNDHQLSMTCDFNEQLTSDLMCDSTWKQGESAVTWCHWCISLQQNTRAWAHRFRLIIRLIVMHVTTDIYCKLQQQSEFWNTIHTGSAEHTESLNNDENLWAEISAAQGAILLTKLTIYKMKFDAIYLAM